MAVLLRTAAAFMEIISGIYVTFALYNYSRGGMTDRTAA